MLAGSLPPGVPNDFYARIVQVLNKHEAQAILDTSGDSQKWVVLRKPISSSQMRRKLMCSPGSRCILLPKFAAGAAEIRRLGAQNVVVSMGKAGALFQTTEGPG